jgi:hypothetical protein
MCISMTPTSRKSSWSKIGAATLALVLIDVEQASTEENCIHQLSEPEPYYVLGSLVTPQSNYVVVDHCTKSADEVRAELVAPARERMSATLNERGNDEIDAQQARKVGDELMQARDEAKKAANAERHWWSWMWD